MSRLSITLDDNLHRALKETAARQGRSITSIIEESVRNRALTKRWSWLSRRHAPLASDEPAGIRGRYECCGRWSDHGRGPIPGGIHPG